MGRHSKVIAEDHIDKRELGYYATPDFIAAYLGKRLLMIQPQGEKVLDPAVGQEELLHAFYKKGKHVDGMDVFAYKENYHCQFIQRDFIEYYAKLKQQSPELIATDDNQWRTNVVTDYDYIIANPPYNCHEVNYIRDNKQTLQALFSDVGVHNMYSMFISAIIDIAKEGAVIGLVTHDSFFTAKAHTKLRRKILTECAIHEITMCPNDLFHEQAADVRTSIVILQKGKQFQQDVFVNNRPLTTDLFTIQLQHYITILQTEKAKKHPLAHLILHSKKDNDEFIIDCPDDIRRLFTNERLGDKFTCITGISTGNDALYLSKEKKGKFTIPFYKNPGSNRFFTHNFLYLHEDFLTFDQEISNFIVRNKSHLFQSGISCSSMGVQFTACRLPEDTTYGVNANIICADEDVWWLLAYLNSELVAYLVRGMLIRSNMITSGYVNRIPLLDINRADKEKLTDIASEAFERAKNKQSYDGQLAQINELIYSIAQLSEATIQTIQHFNQHIVKHT